MRASAVLAVLSMACTVQVGRGDEAEAKRAAEEQADVERITQELATAKADADEQRRQHERDERVTRLMGDMEAERLRREQEERAAAAQAKPEPERIVLEDEPTPEEVAAEQTREAEAQLAREEAEKTREAERIAQERRDAFAAAWEESLLDNNVDVDSVYANGTEIVIETRSCSRLSTHRAKKKLGKDLRKLGFTQVSCSNGHTKYWDEL